jgi:hypothetical protein
MKPLCKDEQEKNILQHNSQNLDLVEYLEIKGIKVDKKDMIIDMDDNHIKRSDIPSGIVTIIDNDHIKRSDIPSGSKNGNDDNRYQNLVRNYKSKGQGLSK